MPEALPLTGRLEPHIKGAGQESCLSRARDQSRAMLFVKYLVSSIKILMGQPPPGDRRKLVYATLISFSFILSSFDLPQSQYCFWSNQVDDYPSDTSEWRPSCSNTFPLKPSTIDRIRWLCSQIENYVGSDGSERPFFQHRIRRLHGFLLC